jgi:5-formyltetrahydrofolate cyclo-ligase
MGSPEIAAAKKSLRRELLAHRAQHTDAQRTETAAALARAFASEFGSRVRADPPLRVVALYLSFATEPDTGPLIGWLADQRVRVLAPTLLPDADLGWMDVPHGAPLGLDAITDADVILVPALAADVRGHRLGRGGGSYDRALSRVRPEQTVLAVVHDDEVLAAVPFEPHDRMVDGVLTPSGVRYFLSVADG